MPRSAEWSDFKSPGKCCAYLTQPFPQDEVEVPATELREDGSPEVIGACKAPKYLFRGEGRLYTATLPAWDRLDLEEKLADEDRKEIRAVAEEVIADIASPGSNFNLDKIQSAGLVQHLGLPTHYIDFTSDLDVAAAFAMGSSESCDERKAAICVLDVERALETKCGQIAVFKEHRWCERAKRQRAFGFSPITFSDLKECSNDSPSGHSSQFLHGRPELVDFQPSGDHVHWDEEMERAWSLRYWSREYKDAIPKGYLGKEVVVREDKRFVFPRTRHIDPSG